MAWTKFKTAVVTGAAILLAAGTTTVAVTKLSGPSIEDVFIHHQDDAYLEKAPRAALLRPSRYARQGDWFKGLPGPPERLLGRDREFAWVISLAYEWSPEYMILPPDWPRGTFDFLLTVDNPKAALREEIKKQFGLVAHREVRNAEVLVMKATARTESSLMVNTNDADHLSGYGRSGVRFQRLTMRDVARNLSWQYFDTPLIDETGLTNWYDLDLRWDRRLTGKTALRKEIERALWEQHGIQLRRERRPLEMLVVEHVTK